MPTALELLESIIAQANELKQYAEFADVGELKAIDNQLDDMLDEIKSSI
jgi:hypothetical protein